MISLIDVKYDHGYKEKLLDGLSFEIKKGEIVAIVGGNGCGKSTLLKLINGEDTPDSGTIAISQDMKVMAKLEQIPERLEDNITVQDVIMPEVYSAQQELEAASLEFANPDANMKKVEERYNRALNHLEEVSTNIAHKISTAKQKLNITDDMLDRKYNVLSGGEKTRVNLCTIMSKDPEVLLLDEPTNHLDFEALSELETFVKNCSKTVIVVSHDRYFIDKVADKTVLIENGKAYVTNGGYTKFLKENKFRKEKEEQDYINQQNEINRLEEAAKKLRAFGRIGDNENFFKRAKAIEGRIEKMDTLDRPKEAQKINLDFSVRGKAGNDIIKFKGLTIGFGNKIILDDLDFNLYHSDRICIIGKNGAGKSTLIHTLMDAVSDKEIPGYISGDIKVGGNISIGYIPQEIHFDNEEESVIDNFREAFSGEETRLRSTLVHFGFMGDTIFKPIGKLSGGEKVRLLLAKIIQTKCNILIFDEPTNHIDAETRNTLENALLEYKGTIIFVSHDRYFINKIATSVALLENGKIHRYVGNYDDYIHQINKANEESSKIENEKKKAKLNSRKIDNSFNNWK